MSGTVIPGLRKNNAMNKLNSIILFFLSLFLATVFSSCRNNKIHYDIKEQMIKTCNGKAIKNLYIINEKEKVFYHFLKLTDKEGTNSFSLINLNNNYSLENLNRPLKFEEFKLMPKMEYKVSNSTFGDAASSEITVRTGNTEIIVYASSMSCE